MTRNYCWIIANIGTEVGVTLTTDYLIVMRYLNSMSTIVGYDKVAKKALTWPVICSYSSS